MLSNRFTEAIGLALPLLIAVSNAVTAQAECDYAAWLAAHPHYAGADAPLPADSLDQLPTLTAWPDSPEKAVLAEVNRAGWQWDATLRVVVDTNGTVLEAEVVRLDVWADGTDIFFGSTLAALDELAAADSVDVLLAGYMRNTEFSAGMREGNPVRAFLCPNMTAVMSPTPRDKMGFSIIGPTFFAIQIDDDSAAAEWYRNALGLRQINHMAAEDGSHSIRLMAGGDLNVELIHMRDAAAPATQPHLGLFKAGFFVDDIDAAFNWLRSRGVNTDARVMIDPKMQVRMFVFRDLAGNRLQVFERCDESCGT